MNHRSYLNPLIVQFFPQFIRKLRRFIIIYPELIKSPEYFDDLRFPILHSADCSRQHQLASRR